MPERAPTKTQLCLLSIIDQLRVWAHQRSAYPQLSPLYPSLYPYVTHMINYTRPSPTFPYCKRRKAGRGLGTRLDSYNEFRFSAHNETTLPVVLVCFITHAHITCTASLLPDRRQTAFGH